MNQPQKESISQKIAQPTAPPAVGPPKTMKEIKEQLRLQNQTANPVQVDAKKGVEEGREGSAAVSNLSNKPSYART